MSQENSNDSTVQVQGTGGILGAIERIGNRIPDITMLFIAAFVSYRLYSHKFISDTFIPQQVKKLRLPICWLPSRWQLS